MNKLTSQIKQILLQELRDMKPYGVDQIGYRYFLQDGRSLGLPTNGSWYNTNKDEKFYEEMKLFLSKELINLQKHNYSYVSRSEDHRYSGYIESLKKMNMHNSVGIYKFSKKRIDSFFYIYENHFGEKRDIIFNNLKTIEQHTNNIIYRLRELKPFIEENDNYEFILNQEFTDKLFKKHATDCCFPKSIEVIIKERAVYLTPKELNILISLKYSISNQSIANSLDISVSTVEKHLHKLRVKLGLFTKEELQQFAFSSAIVNNFKR